MKRAPENQKQAVQLRRIECFEKCFGKFVDGMVQLGTVLINAMMHERGVVTRYGFWTYVLMTMVSFMR